MTHIERSDNRVILPPRSELAKVTEQRDLLAVALRQIISVYEDAGEAEEYAVVLARRALRDTRMEGRRS